MVNLNFAVFLIREGGNHQAFRWFPAIHMTKDLTTGSPARCIIGFAMPMFLGMLFQQLYNMVDTMIVGQFLGLNPLAGVGSTSSLYFLVIGSCIGVCSGFSIPISQMFGAKDDDAVRRFMMNSAWLTIALAVLVTTATVIWCRPMLTLMNTPAEAYEYAYQYIVIIFAGIPFTLLYNMISSIIRALGDSRSPVVFLIISSLLNIILDLVFILVIPLNVAGAALATVVSQAVAGIISFFYMKKKFPLLKLQSDEWRLSGAHIQRLCVIGLPMGLQYSITAIGSIAVQFAVNSFGAMAVAGVTAAQKVHTLLACPLEALGPTMGTYTGQNVGAGKLKRVTRGLIFAYSSGIVLSLAAFLISLIFGNTMSMLFISPDETDALSYSSFYLLVTTASFVFLTFVNTVRFTIQGMGFSIFAMTSGCLEMAARCFAAFILTGFLGFTGVCFSNTAAWVAADLFLIPAFFLCRKRMAAMLPEDQEKTD